MKKLFFTIFIITIILTPLFFAYKLQKVEALGKNDPGIISFVLNSATKNPQNNKWTWQFTLQTQNVGDNTAIDFSITDESGTNLYSDSSVKINNNGAIYKLTDAIPDNNITYSLVWKMKTLYTGSDFAQLTATYTCKAGNTSNCSAKINNAIPVSADDPTIINAKAAVVFNNSTIYKMLAPIGDIKCMDSSGLDKTCIPNDIGKYLNVIFKLAIGICAALAVIMLIINGVKYMGDESVFGKTEAKKGMFGAIVGLLIALGAWALLNTINPALTGQNGLNISSADVQLVPLYDRGVNDPKNANGESVNCTPVTNPNSPCTVANLTSVFGAADAVAMSKICNMETRGTSIASGTDICKPGNTAFSFGLFQVNLSSNGILAGADCVGLFNKAVVGADAIPPKYTSGFTCNLLPGKEDLYSKCKSVLLDTTQNLAIAKGLFTKYKKQPWLGDRAACASAFQ